MSKVSRCSPLSSGVWLPYVLHAVDVVVMLLVCNAWAAMATNPASQVTRLPDSSGMVSLTPTDSDDWVGASLNRPFITRDRL